MTDTLNRILVIIWTKLAALLQPEQGGSQLLSLSIDSADWYQSCTFLAQKGEMKGEGKEDPYWHPYNSATGILSPMCMAFALGQNGEGTPIGVVGSHPEVLIRILYCIIINT